MNEYYKRQVALMLMVLPEVARETCFALHGGTAINLFIRNLPRLSVDIDVTYLPIEDREKSLTGIVAALIRIEANIRRVIPGVKIRLEQEKLKLQISRDEVQIIIEVNQMIRGCIAEPERRELCDHAQEMFDAFCAIRIVPKAQLFGGKLVAALDRQHPRDLFDVRYLLREESINEEIKVGFLFSLLSSNRPMNELLNPNKLDQRKALENQFEGMSREPFSYEEFEETREELIQAIKYTLTKADQEFLISIKSLKPDWTVYDFEKFPSIQWKLENLKNFKAKNPSGYEKALAKLTELLS
jgi:predicted nucleotidyltransferase component of viral defense system